MKELNNIYHSVKLTSKEIIIKNWTTYALHYITYVTD